MHHSICISEKALLYTKRKANKNHAFFQIKKILTLKYFKNIVLIGFWRVVFQEAKYGT